MFKDLTLIQDASVEKRHTKNHGRDFVLTENVAKEAKRQHHSQELIDRTGISKEPGKTHTVLTSDIEINPAVKQLSKRVQYDKLTEVAGRNRVTQDKLQTHFDYRKGSNDVGLSTPKFKYDYLSTGFNNERTVVAIAANPEKFKE